MRALLLLAEAVRNSRQRTVSKYGKKERMSEARKDYLQKRIPMLVSTQVSCCPAAFDASTKCWDAESVGRLRGLSFSILLPLCTLCFPTVVDSPFSVSAFVLRLLTDLCVCVCTCTSPSFLTHKHVSTYLCACAHVCVCVCGREVFSVFWIHLSFGLAIYRTHSVFLLLCVFVLLLNSLWSWYVGYRSVLFFFFPFQ